MNLETAYFCFALRNLSMNETVLPYAPNSEIGQLRYIYTPTPALARAKFVGVEAKCGSCSKKLGEFGHVDGRIKCKKCGAMNVVRR